MTPEHWHQIKEHLARLLTLDTAARAAYLQGLEDAGLRAELEDLLVEERAGGLQVHDSPGTGGPHEQESSAAPALPAHVMVGPYRIVSVLGAGGMGEVFRARDERLCREVALKRLPPRWTTDADRVRRFEREALAASALNHPNILTVHDILSSHEGRFIVTELVDGETLRDWIRRGPLPLHLAMDIALQMASALAAAHAAGIVHRDIKPANVMVRADGVVKLLDFGIAKLTGAAANPADETAIAATAAGVMVGTLRYMSPEQARGRPVDHRTDLFSLGVVVYEMVTGTLPFGGGTASDVVAAILRAEPTPLRAHLPLVPQSLEETVGKALRKDADRRYQAAQDMRTDLLAVQRHLAGAQALAAAPATTIGAAEAGHALAEGGAHGPRARRRRWTTRWTTLAACGVVALAALGAYSYKGRGARSVLKPESAEAPPSSPAPLGGRPRQPGFASGMADLRWIAVPGTGTPWRAEFDMGCVIRDLACDDDEKPLHRVTLTQPYALLETEVTVGQYAAFLRQTGHRAPRAPAFPQEPDHPVVGVSWDDAATFCQWAGGRLPTEAEWEYAARAGIPDNIYSWRTDNAATVANFGGVDDGYEFTAPVARFAPSRAGFYDLSGNAWEWVSDWYAASYANAATVNPKGPLSGDRRVLRGGAWSNGRRNGRLSDRGRNAPDYLLAVYGVRCAKDVPP